MKDNIDKENIKIVVEKLNKHRAKGIEEDGSVSVAGFILMSDFPTVATSILKALPRLDRDNVEKIINRMLGRFAKVALGDKRWGNDTVDKYVDKILSLIPTDIKKDK